MLRVLEIMVLLPQRHPEPHNVVILNLFQDNTRRLCVIPKQVRDDDEGCAMTVAQSPFTRLWKPLLG
jgi:hypothetical protein